MSDRKYKCICLVDEKKRNTNDLKGQQLGFTRAVRKLLRQCWFLHKYATYLLHN